MLGPFLFNICIKKLILSAETTNGCNYAPCKRHNILCMLFRFTQINLKMRT